MSRIGIIIGSTRPGRIGAQVAEWVHQLAQQRTGATYELIDLQDFDLPMYAEAVPAALSEGYEMQSVRDWSDRIDALDGFVFVTPEYNRSIPGSLKNAIDYLASEFNNKAAGIISYGSSGGVIAASHLRMSLSTLQVATVEASPTFNLFTDFENFTTFTPTAVHEPAVNRLLGQVEAWAGGLAGLRTVTAQAA